MVTAAVKRAHAGWALLDDSWVQNAPEYFVTTIVSQYIATKLRSQGKKYFIRLEVPVLELLEAAGDHTRGRTPKLLRKEGKVDICVYHNNDTPRALVEIKNRTYLTSAPEICKDLSRMAEVLLRQEHCSLAILVMYASSAVPKIKHNTAKEYLEDQARKWAKFVADLEWSAPKRQDAYREAFKTSFDYSFGREETIDNEIHAWAVFRVDMKRHPSKTSCGALSATARRAT